MAEGVGNAPTSARADPVFETGAASLYLPAFQNWSGWSRRRGTPATSSFRLRSRGTAADITPWKNGTRGRSLTFIPGVRTAVLCGLSYASVKRWWERKGLHLRPPACRAGALQLSYVPGNGAPGWILTTGLRLRTTALCSLSYGERIGKGWSGRPDSRRRSPRRRVGCYASSGCKWWA